MHRGYGLIIVLLLSSLACGLITTTTPSPTRTSIPTQAATTPAPMENSPTAPTSTQIAAAETTPAPTQEEPTKTPYPTSVLDAQMSQEVNLIQTQVSKERGLQSEYPVPVVLLSTDALRQNVVNDFLADTTDEDLADQTYELSIIGLLEPDFDFRNFYINLLSEQIAGYYDNDMKEMFVVQGQGFQGPERLTYAHEYTHVLQDQNYDIENGLNYSDDACEGNDDRCYAVLALLEGDATLSQFNWFQYYSTKQDQQQVIEYYNTLKSPVYDSAPAFMKDDFVFPYDQGFSFVQAIYDQGGWSAVDDLYKNPPASTEQILHPKLYPDDTPIRVDLPDLVSVLGENWREVSRDQVGEWYTYLILARGVDSDARLKDSTAQAATAGWGGDLYIVLHNDVENTTAFVMKTIWDTNRDASEFASALQKYANIRFGVSANKQGDVLGWTYSGGYSSLYNSGDTTIWIITPDASTAQSISSLVQP